MKATHTINAIAEMPSALQLARWYGRTTSRGIPISFEPTTDSCQAQFEAAVYNHTHVVAYMQGTVMFLIHDGKPMVRIFLNQEDDEIKAGRDFIAPQFAWATGNHAFKWASEPLLPGGVAVLGLDIDATGHITA